MKLKEKDNKEFVVSVNDKDEKTRRRAKKEDSNELLKFGQKYYTGTGVKQDYSKAFECLKNLLKKEIQKLNIILLQCMIMDKE